MRSIVGVGITPPKVLGTPKPASSVMIRRTFGALFGGMTRGGHQGLDCSAPSLITPPNFGSGGGSCLPVMVVVAPADPGVPVICWAPAGSEQSGAAASSALKNSIDRLGAVLMNCLPPALSTNAQPGTGRQVR